MFTIYYDVGDVVLEDGGDVNLWGHNRISTSARRWHAVAELDTYIRELLLGEDDEQARLACRVKTCGEASGIVVEVPRGRRRVAGR